MRWSTTAITLNCLTPRIDWDGQWPFETHSGRKIERNEFHGEYENSSQIAQLGVLPRFDKFLRFDLIFGCKNEIRGDWLRLVNAVPIRAVGEFLICITCGGHMADRGSKIDANDLVAKREDSILRRASRLTETEIRRLVKTVSHTSLHWLVDDPDDPMLERVRDLGGVVHCLGGMEDFRLIHSFRKVAIGQSAFQWWAAFLGAAREIYFPPIDRGIWSHPEPADLITDPWWWGIDLRVPGDGRYIYEW